MALKCIVNDIVEVPAGVRDHYRKASDGKFALALDGDPLGYVKTERLGEFRDNNRALHSQKTELEKTNAALEERLKAFDGIDPAEYESDGTEYEAMEAKLKDLEARLRVFDGVDPEEYRALKERPDTTGRLAELEATLAAEKGAHAATQFNNTIAAEFLQMGGRASAVEYMVGLAAKTFSVKDGKVETNEVSAVNPGEPLTVREWMQAQVAVADFAFQPSRGGGATGSFDGGQAGARRTISRDPLEFGQNILAIAAGDVTVE
ncbi:MAG TPA: hypothetical protein VNJ02_18495 [Vicinamibacterales bacterium]|nr:hypothetical protein [Vicinamibacterales bacterium]